MTDALRTIDQDVFWRRAMLASAGLTVALAIVALSTTLPLLAHIFLLRQDIAVLLAIAAMCVGLAGLGRKFGYTAPLFALSSRQVVLFAFVIAMLCAFGFFWVLWGRDFSRDEQMALFDAHILASGRWAGTIPIAWLDFRAALNTVFLDPALTGQVWASDYRPVSAALHAIGIVLGAPHIVGPLSAGLALVATWRCARVIWPDDPDAATVVVATLALSAQFLVTGMTAYAMTPLLAFNMAWLLLVWRNDMRGHGAALALGFFATGLHQVLYHPLFAFPVAALFLLQRRWTLATVYAVAYLSFVLFWESFSGLRADWVGAVPAPAAATADATPTGAAGSLLAQASGLAAQFGPESFAVQSANLVRLISWQHLLFVPLLGIGALKVWRSRDPRLLSLLAIIVLAVVAKTLLRPYQGHGWGYRYMHGALGVACLLCGAGWIELRERGLADRRLFLAASLVTALALIPLRLVQAHDFSGVYARPALAAAQSRADIVIVDDSAAPFSQDIVVNDPFVRNEPVLLLASQLHAGDIGRLCARGPIAVVDHTALEPINVALDRPIATARSRSADAVMAAAAQCQTRARSARGD